MSIAATPERVLLLPYPATFCKYDFCRRSRRWADETSVSVPVRSQGETHRLLGASCTWSATGIFVDTFFIPAEVLISAARVLMSTVSTLDTPLCRHRNRLLRRATCQGLERESS